MAAPKQTDPQFKLRMPQALKDALDRSVSESGRSLNAEIVWRLERSFDSTEQDLTHKIEVLEQRVEDFKAGYYVDMSDDGMRKVMMDRLNDVMSSVIEDMQEEQRITQGMPLLLKWFDDNPPEKKDFDALSPEQQDRFVHEKVKELWIDHLNSQRQQEGKRKASQPLSRRRVKDL